VEISSKIFIEYHTMITHILNIHMLPCSLMHFVQRSTKALIPSE